MSENSSSHNSRHFVVAKGKAVCSKGTAFPGFNVTSHQKHYWNDEEGTSGYLAVTEDDVTFLPPAAPFGSCSLQNGNPCVFAPAGKWQNTYDKVKIMGKSCVTEISELRCTTGGKITVMQHGQTAAMTRQNIINADPSEQRNINPAFHYGEFRDEQYDDPGICI